MTVVSSFTLGPSSSSSKPQVGDENQAQRGVVQSSAYATHECRKRKEMWDMERHQHSLTARRSLSASSFQATPFHLQVHHRNLPKSGIISPLKVGEYHMSPSATNPSCNPRGPALPCHYPMDTGAPSTVRPHLPCEPPVSEIHVPSQGASHPQEDDEDEDNNSWINGESGENNDYDELSFERLESWKSMYYVAQRDLHVAREESQVILDENRRLKRHLFELQRRLYDSQRKRQRLANDMWNVPGAPEPSIRKVSNEDNSSRERPKTVKIQEDPHRHHQRPHVPRAISCEESSSCKSPRTDQKSSALSALG